MSTTITSAMRRVVVVSLGWLYNIQEGIIVIAAIGGGVMLAFGLYSPSQDLAIAIVGISVYLATILMDPLKGLILWLVTQPLLEGYLNISLGDGIPDLSLTRLCIATITVLLLARTAIGHYRLLPVSKLDVLAFLFILGMTLSAFRGRYMTEALQQVFDHYWVPVLIYFAVKNLVTDRRSVHLVLYAVLFIGLYSAVYAFYETITGNVLFSSSEKVQFYFDSGLRILRGIWDSNVDFGRVFVMAIPILFYFYLKNSSLSRKFLLVICLALVFGALYLTYKRTAWIAMVTVMFVMQFLYPQFRRLFIVLFIVVTIAIALNWDHVSTSTVYTDRINSKSSTADDRTEKWELGLEFWAARPLLGHGFRQYANVARETGRYQGGIHNEHLRVLVSAGLVGFLPYVGLLLLMAYDGLQHYRGRVVDGLADPDLIAVFWGILIGYVITISTSTVTHLMIPSMLFAVAGAILYSRRFTPSRPYSMDVERGGTPLHWYSNGGLQKY